MTANAQPLPPLNGAVALPDWGLIRAAGEDARSFLHGQLTQDMQTLAPGEARLAGFCSVKGRLQATFVVWQEAEGGDVTLACSADLLAATLKRLSMFVLRAKCKLSDASAERAVFGLAGDAVPDMPPGRTQAGADGLVVRLPDGAGTPRALWVGAAGTSPPRAALSIDDWRWLEVASGVPRIMAATAEQFVPQMVNLEVVGGVNFKKGCFPGQEIVARSQYRGTLKRRAYVVSADTPLQPGQEVFDAADPGQPAGMVVLAGTRAGREHAALVELKIAQAESDLQAGDPTGPRLQLGALPYTLPTEAT